MSDKNKRSEEQAKKASELLPCPFCGGEAKFITGSPFIWEHAVACGECGTATRMIGGVTPSMARNRVAQVWNTRKPMQEICERLEQQVRQCEIRQKEFQSTNATVKISEKFYSKACSYDNAITIVKEVGGMNEL